MNILFGCVKPVMQNYQYIWGKIYRNNLKYTLLLSQMYWLCWYPVIHPFLSVLFKTMYLTRRISRKHIIQHNCLLLHFAFMITWVTDDIWSKAVTYVWAWQRTFFIFWVQVTSSAAGVMNLSEVKQASKFTSQAQHTSECFMGPEIKGRFFVFLF